MKTVLLNEARSAKRIVNPSRSGSAFDTFEMADLYTRDTGLNRTVWVSPRGNARHDARVKVCLTPGDRMDADQRAVVALRPEPRLLSGYLPARELAPVAAWIALNQDALIGYWDGTLSTVEMVTRLQRLPAP